MVESGSTGDGVGHGDRSFRLHYTAILEPHSGQTPEVLPVRSYLHLALMEQWNGTLTAKIKWHANHRRNDRRTKRSKTTCKSKKGVRFIVPKSDKTKDRGRACGG